MTLIGFAYGFWPGAIIATTASMLGASIAFISVRVRPSLSPLKAHDIAPP